MSRSFFIVTAIVGALAAHQVDQVHASPISDAQLKRTECLKLVDQIYYQEYEAGMLPPNLDKGRADRKKICQDMYISDITQ
jgi:hypothetical protein